MTNVAVTAMLLAVGPVAAATSDVVSDSASLLLHGTQRQSSDLHCPRPSERALQKSYAFCAAPAHGSSPSRALRLYACLIRHAV
eukprot:3374299-Prymnesium_polylepis.2